MALYHWSTRGRNGPYTHDEGAKQRNEKSKSEQEQSSGKRALHQMTIETGRGETELC